MDIAKEDRTLDSCAHRGKVQPCRNRSRQRIGIDLETIWDDDVYPIGVAIVMVMMAVFLVSFAVTRRWKSCTMDSSQLCAAHCQWPDDSFNARHIINNINNNIRNAIVYMTFTWNGKNHLHCVSSHLYWQACQEVLELCQAPCEPREP